jgi:uncharacterized membrane protein YdjX (TVP38/TMEM64 family)
MTSFHKTQDDSDPNAHGEAYLEAGVIQSEPKKALPPPILTIVVNNNKPEVVPEATPLSGMIGSITKAMGDSLSDSLSKVEGELDAEADTLDAKISMPSMDTYKPKDTRVSRWMHVLGVIVVVSLLAFIAIQTTKNINHLIEVLERDAEGNPVTGVLVMIAAISIGTPLGAAMTPFNLAAGGLFGVWLGSFCVMAGCLIGCNISFMVSRQYLRAWAAEKIKESPSLRKLEAAVENQGIQVVALGRLSPMFPFALVSYVLGVTNISMCQVTTGTAIGLLPGILLQSSMGHNMKRVMEGHGDNSVWYSITFSIISMVFISWHVKRMWDALPEADQIDMRERAGSWCAGTEYTPSIAVVPQTKGGAKHIL